MATYFLSDLHLGAANIPDQHEAERRVCRFLDSIKNDAESIFLVGDILDYWFEYRYAVPRGYVRFFGKLAELSDAGVKITWLIGNHDIWIFDYLPRELGIEVVDGYLIREIQGKKFFIAHGDGVGQWPLSFRFIRGLFRNKVCQKMYSWIHPRWTIPFATGCSKGSRARQCETPVPNPANEVLADFATEYHQQHPDIDCFLFGHTHSPEIRPIGEGARMVVLGDWIRMASYARLEGGEISLHDFEK